jgi:membrane associated rhomboid family serine protease
MLPVQDVLPSRTTPWVTLALIAVIVLMLAVEILLSEPVVRTLILSYGLVPTHVSWWAPVTSVFLHHGATDAAANLVMLWIYGDNVEDRLGHGRFLLFVLCCGVAAGLAAASLATTPVPLIGAGGAVGGVIGAYLVLLPASRVFMLVPVWRGLDLVEIPAALLVGFWVLAIGLAPVGPQGPAGIPLALVTQTAGLLVGAAGVFLFRRQERLGCAWWNVPTDQPPPDRRRTSRDTSASSVSNASS